MDDRMATLRKLEAVVVRGHKYWSAHDVRVAFGANHQAWFLHAKQGSLDAAHSLHEALLPGFGWYIRQEPCGTPCASVLDPDQPIGEPDLGCLAKNPARAWLLAIIRALIAKLEAGDG